MANKDIPNTELKWKRFEDTLKALVPDLAMRNKVALFLADWVEDMKVELKRETRENVLDELEEFIWEKVEKLKEGEKG